MDDRRQRDFAELADGFSAAPEWDEREYCERKAAELVSAVRDICDLHGHKVVAKKLGRKYAATLTQAVKPGARSNRNHIYLRDMPRLILLDHSGALSNVLASIATEPWTDRELVTALSEAARELYQGEAHKGFMRATRRRLQRNRVIAKNRGSR